MKAFGIEMEDKTALIIGGVVIVLAYWTVKKTADTVSGVFGEIGTAFNPTSHENIFYRGVNSIGEGLTGDKDWTLGFWLYDVIHPNELEKASKEAKKGGASGSW